MYENPTFPTSTPVFDGRGFLVHLKASGIVLEAGPGGRIRFEAPAGKFTAELRAMAAEHRAELLELLASGPGGPQNLQPHGDVAGPVAADDGSQGAGPSETDRPAGQAQPGCGPHEASGSRDAHGDAGAVNGSQDLAAAPQAMAGQATPRRLAYSVAVEWPAAAADFALLLAVDDLPLRPFRLNGWREVRDAARFLRWLRADIRRGPTGPRAFYGALQSDLQALQRFALAAGDGRQNETQSGKAGGL